MIVRNEAKVMKWGLVPSWAPDPSMGQRMINARSETLLEKPSFQASPTETALPNPSEWVILQPVPSERLEAYEVSPLVNLPDHDSPECVRRVTKQANKLQLPLL